MMRFIQMCSVAALACACNAPEPSRDGKGTDAQQALVVLSSDYQSSNVSLLGFDGAVLSPSVLHSGSAAPGLSAALSGDVVLPTSAVRGRSLVLIDRVPDAVLTWVDPRSARVRAQLPVGTGFQANPHDYVGMNRNKAYVPRFERNGAPGARQYDAGDDVLIIDPELLSITGRVDLQPALAGEAPKFQARPEKTLAVGGRAYVLLNGYDSSFSDSATPRIAVLDGATDQLLETRVIAGARSCMGFALSPAEDAIAVACSGRFASSESPTLEDSLLVVLSLGESLVETARFGAGELQLGPFGNGLAFASASRLVLTTYGRDVPGAARMEDALIELDIGTREHRLLLRSDDLPFSLGDVRCLPRHATCFVTDAKREGGVVHRFTVGALGLSHEGAIRIENEIGLPPRYLGEFYFEP